MSAIRLQCPACRKVCAVPATAAGKPASCPACGTAFRVPRHPGPDEDPDSSGDGTLVVWTAVGCVAFLVVTTLLGLFVFLQLFLPR
jgi:hypothetical protein